MEKRAAASTVNLALASLDALYRCLGLGRPHVRRGKPGQAAPRALDEAGQRRLLRAAEAAPIRARALVMLMLFTALRISETVALNLDDVRITTRKGVLVVFGKGEIQREVPLNALVRQILDEWLEQRDQVAREGSGRCGSAGPAGGFLPASRIAISVWSRRPPACSSRRTRRAIPVEVRRILAVSATGGVRSLRSAWRSPGACGAGR